MAVKRRVVWLSDEEWAKLGERAEAFKLTRSAYLRKLIEWRQPSVPLASRDVGTTQWEPTFRPMREFAEFRPVPKPAKRK